MSRLIDLITAEDPRQRDRDLAQVCEALDASALGAECAALDAFWRASENLYERVRAQLFLHAIHRYHLPPKLPAGAPGRIPFAGHEALLARQYAQAIDLFLAEHGISGPTDAISSALAEAYRGLAFQTLADQVRRSVRESPGNRWMFDLASPEAHPLRARPEMLAYPRMVLRERTPVRMDLTHCGWSDIFFLGMDYPEGARVLNISIDLAVRGRGGTPQPPVEVFLRVIDEPVLRLISVDLGAAADLTRVSEVFDFGRDYLGLLKAAVVASGLVPLGLEGSPAALADILARVAGPGRGIELISHVHDIPKGSRLAVSTTLLASLIAVCMRATGQTSGLDGGLNEEERRRVAARAILGEWLAGSGGGWQDSGGLWPGIKLIEGVMSRPGDPEYGVSRGRLLPSHRLLDFSQTGPDRALDQALQDSLVLVHGGMAQNVGPILEMVTEKYLLRSDAEWEARQEAQRILGEVLAALEVRDPRAIGAATTRNFRGPLTTIIPWATNHYTESLIGQTEAAFGADFWGFWMLGGMSGGGMGFIFAPGRKSEGQAFLERILRDTRRALDSSMPFAMEPVVYDFAINHDGSQADRLTPAELPAGYARLRAPRPAVESASEDGDRAASGSVLRTVLAENGFDALQHERIRADLRHGRIGLAHNRLAAHARIEDVRSDDILDMGKAAAPDMGARALAAGEVAMVSLAAGAGSRWTQGAGVVKALYPFCRMAGRHRRFLEVHLAQSRKASRAWGADIPHVVTTSYVSQAAISAYLSSLAAESRILLSPGRAIGLRLVPMTRDLRFMWEEMPQQQLDAQQQKLREGSREALTAWAAQAGEGADYLDNLPAQCLHPVGHWYEAPNMLRNGVLARLLRERPALRTLMLRNIDTVGADMDPGILGAHLQRGAALSFEVIPRRLEDRGGGLARVDGRPRIVEGLAMPREEDEFRLSYYNTMTTWIDIDGFLALFGLNRADLENESRVSDAVRSLANRMPTYVTLKDVKKRWGHGQEDIFPVCQFEKLWSDLSALPDADCAFLVVARARGQQLKDPAQLDGWLRDGSAARVEALCDFV
ncbi:MAG TPA: UTP--glucose-1-phosphate uridylyltransferase [Thermoflexales bacterium]|nr:UTP--glucose-1-phosphate uridylyltransferase [Thermoflexales bacterium]